VYIEGSLRTRKWTDKDGVEKYTTEIRADQMQMLGKREGMGAPSADDDGGYDSAPRRPAAPPQRASAPGQQQRPAASKPATGFDDMDDDIPF
jgi:single-strand DNA-binding protein